MKRKIAVWILVVAVLQPGASQCTSRHACANAKPAAAAAANAVHRYAGHTGAARGRPLDGARHRHADHARVADERGRRRRDGDVHEPVAAARQDAGHDLDVRLGARRRRAPLRRLGRSRRGPPRRAGEAAVPERERSTSRATAATWCSRAACRRKDIVGKGQQPRQLGFVEKKEDVVNLLQVQDAPEQPGAAAGAVRGSQPHRR